MKTPQGTDSLVEYEMGYGAEEFGQVLQGSFSGEKSVYRCDVVACNHWHISQSDVGFALDVEVVEMPPRRLGLLALPVLRVTFKLHQDDMLLREQFFSRFFKYFHKGGG